MCDCRRNDLLLELRKRMAEFDDNSFRSSSMCVCVCVCMCVCVRNNFNKHPCNQDWFKRSSRKL
jgi:hypothetical protein